MRALSLSWIKAFLCLCFCFVLRLNRQTAKVQAAVDIERGYGHPTIHDTLHHWYFIRHPTTRPKETPAMTSDVDAQLQRILLDLLVLS